MRLLLTRTETTSEEILEAMDAGDLRIDAAVAADPSLVVDFIEQQGRRHRKEYAVLPPPEQRQAQCRLLQHMLDLGASPWPAGDRETMHVLESALSSANPELARMLIDHPDCPSGLIDNMLRTRPHWIFSNRHPEMLQVLFDAGLNPHVRQENTGNSLLHEAVNANMARFVITSGVDPAAINNKGQDAAAWWDLRGGRTVAERQALDDVLAASAPPDPASFVASLGEQWMTVGATVCKARIKATLAVEPSSIIHEGLTLPEMVLARIIGQELKPNGNEVKHRKLRRTILSVMAYCDILRPEHVVPGSGLHTALGIFRQAELALVRRQNPAIPSQNRGGIVVRRNPDPPAKDATGQTINEMLHLRPGAGIGLDPSLAISWIEHASSVGILKNSGTAVLWQLKFNPRMEQRVPTPNKAETLARSLVCLARSQMQEKWSIYNPTSREAMERASSWLEHCSVSVLLDHPHGLPSVMLLLAGAGRLDPNPARDRALATLRAAIEARLAPPATMVDPHDPMVVQAAKDLKASQVDANVDMGNRLDSIIQSAIMHERTENTPSTSRAGPRF